MDFGGMRGCHRKLWENVMEIIVKIEKTNTMTNTWGNTKTRMSENKEQLPNSVIMQFASLMPKCMRALCHIGGLLVSRTPTS